MQKLVPLQIIMLRVGSQPPDGEYMYKYNTGTIIEQKINIPHSRDQGDVNPAVEERAGKLDTCSRSRARQN